MNVVLPRTCVCVCARARVWYTRRMQHPKIRVFARLIGLEDALPKGAQEFYCALLNRCVTIQHCRHALGCAMQTACCYLGRVRSCAWTDTDCYVLAPHH